MSLADLFGPEPEPEPDDPRPDAYGGRTQVDSPIGVDDGVLTVIDNARRRRVVRYMDTAQVDAIKVKALSEQLGAVEADTTPELVHSRDRHRVYIALIQSHLSTMAEHDVITYDGDRKIVGRGDEFETAVRALYAVEQVFAEGDR